MSQKSWNVLRIVAGLYLVYLGISITRGLLSERPEDMLFKSVIAVVFMIVGALYAIFSAKKAWKLNQEERMYDGEAEENTDEEDGDAEADAADDAAEVHEMNSNRQIAEDITGSEADEEEEGSLIDVENDFDDESMESGIETADEEEK